MAFVHYDFWRYLLRCAAKGVSFGRTVLSESKISQFELPVGVDEHVFGLQIPLYQIFGVQMLEYKCSL